MKPVWIVALVLPPLGLAAQQGASDRRALSGSDVAIYNLAGVARLERGTGGDVVVELTRGGADASKLSIATGPLRGRETLRVLYPDDDIVYGELGGGRGWSTTLRVRDDGTFGDSHGDRHWPETGRHIRIRGSGDGLDAHADLRIAIPPGKRVAMYLAVGQVLVSNVDGDLRVDVSAANVTADHVKGSLLVDTGSGDVRVSDMTGDVSLDTGSGNVTLDGAQGSRVNLDTGSGNVTAERVTADVLSIDTGSGDVTTATVRSGDIKIDTGSGNVRLDLVTDLRSLYVDTGSGDVTITVPADLGAAVDIDTGSGDIDLENVSVRTTRLEKDHLTGEIGDGKGRMRIETGSGGVRLVRNK